LLLISGFLGYAVCLFLRKGEGRLTPRDLISSSGISGGRDLIETVAARFGRGFENNAKSFGGALLLALFGVLLLALASDFTVESLGKVAFGLGLAVPLLAMSMLSVAGALPEISSSLEIICKKRYEVALGTVFASTAVNLLLVAGAAALAAPLPAEDVVLNLGLPFLIGGVGLLTISSFSRRINAGQGWMFLLAYFLFLAKLFNLF
jgi:Ca2+/Na+ antiporter